MRWLPCRDKGNQDVAGRAGICNADGGEAQRADRRGGESRDQTRGSRGGGGSQRLRGNGPLGRRTDARCGRQRARRGTARGARRQQERVSAYPWVRGLGPRTGDGSRHDRWLGRPIPSDQENQRTFPSNPALCHAAAGVRRLPSPDSTPSAARCPPLPPAEHEGCLAVWTWLSTPLPTTPDTCAHFRFESERLRTSIIALLLSRRVLYAHAQSPTRAARVQRGLRATLSVRAPANITPHVQPAVLGPPCLCRHLTRRVADGEGSALPGPTSSAKINARMPRDIRWTRLDAFATLCTSFRHVSERLPARPR